MFNSNTVACMHYNNMKCEIIDKFYGFGQNNNDIFFIYNVSIGSKISVILQFIEG